MPRGESFTPFLYGLRKRASRASSLRGGERSAETNGVASVLYEGKSGGGGGEPFAHQRPTGGTLLRRSK